MSRKPSESERRAGAAAEGEGAILARLEKIQHDKRPRVHWQLSRHTAEQAMVAISDVVPRPAYRRSSKSRRRKRQKRLL